MKIEHNVGRQAASIGLLVVMLTWLALAVVAMALGIEEFPGWPIGLVLAILLGWIASIIYREMEVRAIRGWEDLKPDPCTPLASILAGFVNYDSDADSIRDREGPPYGWVPMIGGGVTAVA
ncbi:MAG: hypothetical protein Q8M92_03740, partial [Candidatus Subteraquimicrobiales bacterium]|nr:hypothetical protein [Candidatus Subteraquimicrobiales bacterium]